MKKSSPSSFRKKLAFYFRQKIVFLGLIGFLVLLIGVTPWLNQWVHTNALLVSVNDNTLLPDESVDTLPPADETIPESPVDLNNEIPSETQPEHPSDDLTDPIEPDETTDEDLTEPIDPDETTDEDLTDPIDPDETTDEDLTEPIEPDETTDEDLAEPIEPDETTDEDITEPIEPDETTDEDITEPEVNDPQIDLEVSYVGPDNNEQFYAEVCNSGTTAALDVQVIFRLSNGKTLEQVYASIGADACEHYFVQYHELNMESDQNYDVTVEVTSANQTQEINADNNQFTETIYVPAREIEPEPSEQDDQGWIDLVAQYLHEDSEHEFQGEVCNSGNRSTPSFNVIFRLDNGNSREFEASLDAHSCTQFFISYHELNMERNQSYLVTFEIDVNNQVTENETVNNQLTNVITVPIEQEYHEEHQRSPQELKEEYYNMARHKKWAGRDAKRMLWDVKRTRRHLEHDNWATPEQLIIFNQIIDEMVAYAGYLAEYYQKATVLYDELIAANSQDTERFWKLWGDFEDAHPRQIIDIKRYHMEFPERSYWLTHDFLPECERILARMREFNIKPEAQARLEEFYEKIKTSYAEIKSLYNSLPAWNNLPTDRFELDVLQDRIEDIRFMFDEKIDYFEPWRFLEYFHRLIGQYEEVGFLGDAIADIAEGLKYFAYKLQDLESNAVDISEILQLMTKAKDIFGEAKEAYGRGDFGHAHHMIEKLENLSRELHHVLENYSRIYHHIDWEQFFRDLDEHNGPSRGPRLDLFEDRFENLENHEDLEKLLSQLPPEDMIKIVSVLLKLNPEDLDDLLQNSENHEKNLLHLLKFISRQDNEAEQQTFLERKKDILIKVKDIEEELGNLREERLLTLEELGNFEDTANAIVEYNFTEQTSQEIQSQIDALLENIQAEREQDKQERQVAITKEIAALQAKTEELKAQAKDEKWQNKELVFIDVDDHEWYAQDVEEVQEAGIVSGFKDEYGRKTGKYIPGGFVTRAEFVKMAVLSGGHTESSNRPRMQNALSHAWAQGYIARAEELGLRLVQGEIALDEPATRGEVVCAALEASGFEIPAASEQTYQDVSSSHPHYDCIEYATILELVSGDDREDGTRIFRPNDGINRAEVAKISNRTNSIAGIYGVEETIEYYEQAESLEFFTEEINLELITPDTPEFDEALPEIKSSSEEDEFDEEFEF